MGICVNFGALPLPAASADSREIDSLCENMGYRPIDEARADGAGGNQRFVRLHGGRGVPGSQARPLKERTISSLSNTKVLR